MSRKIGPVLFALGVYASTVLASAQPTSSPTENSQVLASSSPVAYVYTSVWRTADHILGFSANSSGELTSIPGSPFPTSGDTYMAVNGAELFGTQGDYIDSFGIDSVGAIALISSTNAVQFNTNNCGGPANLFLDHTGSTLYDLDYLADCANNGYQAYSGTYSNAISYIATAPASPGNTGPLSFIGNNIYGYNANCYRISPNFYVYQRASDGTLTPLYSINPSLPQAMSGQEYCPGFTAADPTNHLAIVMTPLYDSNLQPAGPEELAVYTADKTGNITTNSSYSNMPQVAVGSVNDIWMAPSGKYLAVAGTKGLQVFHFNGANPITAFTGVVTTDNISQVFWDKSAHLYALSTSKALLHVFSVNSTGVKEAFRSPYKVPDAGYFVVLPKP